MTCIKEIDSTPRSQGTGFQPPNQHLWCDLKSSSQSSLTPFYNKTEIKNSCFSPPPISQRRLGVTNKVIAKRCFEGKAINSLLLSLLINCHCWTDSRKPWGPEIVQWLSWLEFQRLWVLQNTYLWQNYKLLSSPRKLNQKREGGKSCWLKISCNMTNDFHLHSRHHSSRDIASSLKDYNNFLAGLMVYILVPI